MSDLLLDPTRSIVRIHTFAEGLLARLAHDLELVCRPAAGTASRGSDGSDPGGGLPLARGTARVEVPLRSMSVGGILTKDGRVDEGAMSPRDRSDCLEKMCKDVFHAGPEAVVRVEAHVEGGAARVRIVPPNGKVVEALIRPEVRMEKEGALRAQGSLELSLDAMGSSAVKGPMGAFRVKDRVVVLFDLVFVPQPA